jgi:hypothetical protein
VLGGVVKESNVGKKLCLLDDDDDKVRKYLSRKASLVASSCAFRLFLAVDAMANKLPNIFYSFVSFSRGGSEKDSKKNGWKRIPLSIALQRYRGLTKQNNGQPADPTKGKGEKNEMSKSFFIII